MEIEFDPAKDEANVAKHGISLARAAELTETVVVMDERFDNHATASTGESTISLTALP